MNQILSTSLNEKNNNQQSEFQEPKEPWNNNSNKIHKNREPIETKKVLKFFIIALIVFGILLIAAGAFAIYKHKEGGGVESGTEPQIDIDYKSSTSLLVKVTHDKKIQNVVYYWNDEEENEKQADGQYVEFTTEIPKGINTLHIIVTDVNGVKGTMEHEYERESDIVMESDNKKGTVVIKYDSETEIKYMRYKWDDGEEKEITVNTKNVKQEIEAQKGMHTLTVEMIDVEGNKESNVQKVQGVSRPTVEVSIDENNENVIVKATDETGLEKIEYTINSDESLSGEEELSGTEDEYKIPLIEGENKIKIKVYNTNGASATKKIKRTK